MCCYREPPWLHSTFLFSATRAQSTELPSQQISPFPTSSICPGAAPEASLAGSSPDLHLLFTGEGILSPSVLGFLKCICTRAQRQHYLVLRMMQLPLSLANCFPAAPQVSFDHSLPYSLLRLSVSKDQTSLFCFKSIFCECKDLLHAKISFVWEWRCGRTALNNNSLEQKSMLTYS